RLLFILLGNRLRVLVVLLLRLGYGILLLILLGDRFLRIRAALAVLGTQLGQVLVLVKVAVHRPVNGRVLHHRLGFLDHRLGFLAVLVLAEPLLPQRVRTGIGLLVRARRAV